MDILVPICMILVFVMNILGILTNQASLLWYGNLPSFVVTVGGGLISSLLANDLSTVTKIPKVFGVLVNPPKYQEDDMIITLISFSEKARREGLLVLEDDLGDLKDDFLKKGLQLVVDGTDPEMVKGIMAREIDEVESRHDTVIRMFEDMGNLFPAWGMIGTLIGLVAMLRGLGGGGGADKIGKDMAVALITTYYGSVLANGLAIPLAGKLKNRNDDEMLIKNIMLEGILSIQAGDNPRIVKDKLISFLPPSKRAKVNEQVGDR